MGEVALITGLSLDDVVLIAQAAYDLMLDRISASMRRDAKAFYDSIMGEGE